MDSVSVTLSADDGSDGSGVAATEYSLDESESWETYTEPFQISEKGVRSVHYRSTDDAGNIEETKQVEVKIDRTPPIARIGFDPDTRGIVVSGSDGQSDVTVEQREEDISSKRKSWRSVFSWIPDHVRNDKTKIRIHTIITDEAGHTTDVTFTEERKSRST